MKNTNEVIEDRRHLLLSFYLAFFSVLALWLIKILEYSLNDAHFYWLGIHPRTLTGVMGIFTSGLIHQDFYHLGSNSLPLFMGIFMTFYYYRKIAVELFAWIYFVSGFWVWIFARPSCHIGASGFIYGLLSFLFFSGIIIRSTRLMTVSLIIIFMYGGMVWGVLPLEKGISWESHALGALAGFIFAIYFSKKRKLRTKEQQRLENSYWKHHNDTSICPLDYTYNSSDNNE